MHWFLIWQSSEFTTLFKDLNVLLLISLKIIVIKTKTLFYFYFERAPILDDEQCRSKHKRTSGAEV